MADNGYADGLTSDIMMRLVWRKSSDFFVKGAVNLDVASKLFKQYYEVQLRKTWKEGSSVDILYFATNGVLFPRQSVALNSTIRLFEHFGINPSVALYMSQLPRESSFRYYRSDYKLELLFPVNQRSIFIQVITSHITIDTRYLQHEIQYVRGLEHGSTFTAFC